jgi:hypothetical protein
MKKVDIKDLNISDEVWVKAKFDETSIIIGDIHIHLAPTIKNSLYIEEPQPEPAKEPFRQHWSIVDDGGHGVEINRIAADQVNIVKIDDNFYDLSTYLKTFTGYISYAPAQKLTKETDFGIIDTDGNLYKAFWKGKADE